MTQRSERPARQRTLADYPLSLQLAALALWGDRPEFMATQSCSHKPMAHNGDRRR